MIVDFYDVWVERIKDELIQAFRNPSARVNDNNGVAIEQTPLFHVSRQISITESSGSAAKTKFFGRVSPRMATGTANASMSMVFCRHCPLF